jgi:hypothetical protein
MFGFLKTETFHGVFSLLLGIALVSLLKPTCKGEACKTLRAPPLDEIKASTYQLGSKCYQFRAQPIQCPPKGAIEPFLVS